MIENRSICFFSFFLLFLFITFGNVYNPSSTFSQSNQSLDFQVFKTDNNERFAFPYSASNQERLNSTEYEFQDPILNDWILLINNNLTYSNNPEAKTVIQIK